MLKDKVSSIMQIFLKGFIDFKRQSSCQMLTRTLQNLHTSRMWIFCLRLLVSVLALVYIECALPLEGFTILIHAPMREKDK